MHSDHDAKAGVAQIIAQLMGAAYLVYGITHYLPSQYAEYENSLLVGVAVFTVLSLLLSVVFVGVRIDRSTVRPGYDETFAPEAEKAQWALLQTKSKSGKVE